MFPDGISHSHVVYLSVTATMTFLSTVAVILRFTSRMLTLSVRWDDWACLGALIVAYGFLICGVILATECHAGYHVWLYSLPTLEKYMQVSCSSLSNFATWERPGQQPGKFPSRWIRSTLLTPLNKPDRFGPGSALQYQCRTLKGVNAPILPPHFHDPKAIPYCDVGCGIHDLWLPYIGWLGSDICVQPSSSTVEIMDTLHHHWSSAILRSRRINQHCAGFHHLVSSTATYMEAQIGPPTKIAFVWDLFCWSLVSFECESRSYISGTTILTRLI